MAKIDQVKESIGYYKVVFSILIAIDVSFVAWIYQNFDAFKVSEYIVFTSTALFVTFGIIYTNRVILQKIK